MIAKISSGKNIYGLIRYHLRKIENQKASVLLTHGCYTGKNKSIIELSRNLDPYLKRGRKTEKGVFHASLNPSPKDQVSDEQFIKMAEEYMQGMGYGKQPYIVVKHSDIEREHIHIISVRVDDAGNKINADYEFKRSTQICRELELKYQLIPAEKKDWKENTPLNKVDYHAADLKKQIGSVLKGLNSYRCSSWIEYRTLLSLFNIHVQEQTGQKPDGTNYYGIVYSAMDENGIPAGKPLKSSLFGKSFGHKALQRKYWKSKQLLKKDSAKEPTRLIIAEAIQKYPKREIFEQELKKKGIDVIFQENEQRRIYGVTFIDHNTRLVANGSILGKEFSANIFHDLFSTSAPEMPDYEKKEKRDFSENEYMLSFDRLFGDDYAPLPDDALIRDQQRKKRKKRKRGLHF